MKKDESLVLIGVVRSHKDLSIVLKKHWYRIPLKYLPGRKASYIAFYQTLQFGENGKAIRFYARIKSQSLVRRTSLLPDETNHPRRGELYCKFTLGSLRRTRRVIRNDSRRRVSFLYTTLSRLMKSRRLCQLSDAVPLEDMVRAQLKRLGIKSAHEYRIVEDGRCKYRLDFAFFCKSGRLAVECDNEKWHLSRKQAQQDRRKDRYLRKNGWVVLRFKGDELKKDIRGCLLRIAKTVNNLGGTLG